MHSQNQFNRYTNLKRLGFNPAQILDIGAYNGDWSVMLKGLFPSAEFTLIEPNTECLEKIVQNGFQDVHNLLLGDTNREVTFYKCQTGCGEGNSVFKEQSVFPFGSETKTMQTLDSFTTKTFNLVKMDTQGAESLIIQGGIRTVSSAEFVQLETQVQEYNKGAVFTLDIMRQMDVLGFKLFDIIDFHYNSIGLLIQVDLLFARKDCSIFKLNCYS